MRNLFLKKIKMMVVLQTETASSKAEVYLIAILAKIKAVYSEIIIQAKMVCLETKIITAAVITVFSAENDLL